MAPIKPKTFPIIKEEPHTSSLKSVQPLTMKPRGPWLKITYKNYQRDLQASVLEKLERVSLNTIEEAVQPQATELRGPRLKITYKNYQRDLQTSVLQKLECLSLDTAKEEPKTSILETVKPQATEPRGQKLKITYKNYHRDLQASLLHKHKRSSPNRKIRMN